MKKCTRCSNVIDWDKPFCPLCGGALAEVQGSQRIVAGAPSAAEKINSARGDSASVPNVPPAPPMPTAPMSAQAPVPPPPVSYAPPVPPMPPTQARTSPPVPPAPPVPSMSPAQAQVPPPPSIAPPGPVSAPAISGEDRVPAAPLPPPVPQAGLFSQIHHSPGVPASQAPFAPPVPPAPPAPFGEVISQIRQTAAGASPPPGGFFSQIHQPQPAPPRPVEGAGISEKAPVDLPGPPASNANAGLHGWQGTVAPRPSLTFQDLTDSVDGSEASLEDALDALLKSAPPLDFAPPPPEAPPPFFMRRPEGEEPPLPFAATPAGGGTEDVLSPNPPEMTGIDPLAGLTGDAREPDPNAAPQAFVRPQIPPPPAPAIPDLPDDGPQGPALDDDGDFLKMFPGVGG